MSVIFNPASAVGGGGMSIGGAVTGGTPPDYLYVGPGGVLAQAPPAALTKTDDTNVTLTLGGSPSTALLQAASLTLGWTGTLAVPRGGTGLSTASQGDLLYGSAANTLSTLGKNAAATRYLANTGTSNNPQWDLVNLANGVTGNLPIGNLGSGTGASSTTFWRGDGTWATPAGGGGGMSIGGTVTSGTTPSVLYIGAGGVLAQDVGNFGWDDTNKALLIEGQRGLFRVPNVSGANWFEDGSGNFGVTGSQNLGTGDLALASLTSGNQNAAFGSNALSSLTVGSGNFAFGANALKSCVTGNNNFAVGVQSCLNITLSDNVGIGAFSLQQVTTGQKNVAIGGGGVLANMNGGFQDGNVGIGFLAGANVTTAGNCLFIGTQAGVNLSGTAFNDVIIGGWPGIFGSINDIFVLSDGNGVPLQEFNYLTSSVWSYHKTTNPVGLHVYNTWDSVRPAVNYERVCLDWNLTSNVARLASQAGGTGTVRIIAIDGFAKAGAPVNTDLPSGTWALIDDTSGNATWLVFNKAGTIRKVQLT